MSFTLLVPNSTKLRMVFFFIYILFLIVLLVLIRFILCVCVSGKIQERIDKKGAYFHLVAWSLPLVLTITVMALGEIDGSSVVGICFVGYLNHAIRAGFLLGPISAVMLIGGYFLTRGISTHPILTYSPQHTTIDSIFPVCIYPLMVEEGIFPVELKPGGGPSAGNVTCICN